MSDTPRTDAVTKWCPQCPCLDDRHGDVVPAEHAKQLERELNDMRSTIQSALKDNHERMFPRQPCGCRIFESCPLCEPNTHA